MGIVKSVDVKTLKKWLDGKEAILIDVREVEDYNEVCIPGSILMPARFCEPGILPHNPDKKIVFYCKESLVGSRVCAHCVEDVGGKIVYFLKGGIREWVAKGFKVKRN